jgi:hypothetical protein
MRRCVVLLMCALHSILNQLCVALLYSVTCAVSIVKYPAGHMRQPAPCGWDSSAAETATTKTVSTCIDMGQLLHLEPLTHPCLLPPP